MLPHRNPVPLTALAFVCLLLAFITEGAPARTLVVATAEELQQAFEVRADSLEVRLLPGQYHLVPFFATDSSCGNCADPGTSTPITVGLLIRGRHVRLVGPDDRSAVIETHSGYGIFLLDADDFVIENLVITGGERDSSGLATDAAIVAKRSRGIIRGNLITDNIGDSERVARNVVGIIGIAGREGADLIITGNRIRRNSWDGIALYRGARALIEGNVVDGVDAAAGARVGGGRGVGIGLTWDARATIEANLVRRYWKGIGIFVDARATVRGNIVEDVLTWGIALWDASSGHPSATILDNIIYRTGACGASITVRAEGDDVDPGSFTGNVVVNAAGNPKYDSPEYYCVQCALALQSVPTGFQISGNLFFANRRAPDSLPDLDQPADRFMPAVAEICERMACYPSLEGSSFLRRFHRRAAESARSDNP